MRVSQFQKYSQKENAVTNNVLLMLSRLNDINCSYYENIVKSLADGVIDEYSCQPSFMQQIGKNIDGIIDGCIEIKPSKIIIETKLNTKESLEKLLKYSSGFEGNSNNILWHLSSEKYSDEKIRELQNILDSKEEYKSKEIKIVNISYRDIVENLEGIYSQNIHDMELKLLFDDFRDYCYEMNLIQDNEFKLLFVPTGKSFEWNIKHKMYYCPKNWHKQNFNYFGIYISKTIKYITRIECTIEADYDHIQKKVIFHNENNCTTYQKERIKKALLDLNHSQKNLKYYLFPESEFEETSFNKSSKGGLQGYRYINLREYLKTECIRDNNRIKDIAEMLKGKKW